MSLALVLESSRDDTCVWHDRVDDVLRLVAELKEEEERLKIIREYERNQPVQTLPPLRKMQKMEAQEQSEEPDLLAIRKT